MALQNLDVSDSLIKLGVYLKTSERIKAFCKDQFGKEISIYAGDFLRKDIPDERKTPYIVMTDFRKKEGQNIEFCDYEITFFVGVSCKKVEWIEESGIIMPDVFDVGAKLMTLIEDDLNDETKRERPISKVIAHAPYPINPTGTHWVGDMVVTFRIYQTMGTNYQEDL